MICLAPRRETMNLMISEALNVSFVHNCVVEAAGRILAGAGGIEPCNNPLLHKDFSIPAHPFDSIFDSKAKPRVGMTDDEVAYIEAKGWKASVVPELSIINLSTDSAFVGVIVGVYIQLDMACIVTGAGPPPSARLTTGLSRSSHRMWRPAR
jgi:hypothetical protein